MKVERRKSEARDMADEIEESLLEQVKKQGELVRKLKAAKVNDSQDSTASSDIERQLESIDCDFADVSYVCGWLPTTKDAILFDVCVTFLDDQLLSKCAHLKRWFANIGSFNRVERDAFPEPKGPVTSLARKVDCMSNLVCLCGRDKIDRKVRAVRSSSIVQRSFARKQTCYKPFLRAFVSQVFSFFRFFTLFLSLSLYTCIYVYMYIYISLSDPKNEISVFPILALLNGEQKFREKSGMLKIC